MPDTYIFAVVCTALIILVLHWFRWPRILDRLIAYAIGVTSILVGLAIWLGSYGQWTTWFQIAGTAIATAGAIGLASLPKATNLHRLIAYSLGVASILMSLAIWLGSSGQWRAWWMIVGIAAAAGLATTIAYAIDWLLNLVAKDAIHERTSEPD